MTGRLVAMDEAFVGCAIDHRNGGLKGGARGFGISGANRLDDLLERGTELTALRGVALAVLLGLTGTLAGLSGISQRNSLQTSDKFSDQLSLRMLRRLSMIVNHLHRLPQGGREPAARQG